MPCFIRETDEAFHAPLLRSLHSNRRSSKAAREVIAPCLRGERHQSDSAKARHGSASAHARVGRGGTRVRPGVARAGGAASLSRRSPKRSGPVRAPPRTRPSSPMRFSTACLDTCSSPDTLDGPGSPDRLARLTARTFVAAALGRDRSEWAPDPRRPPNGAHPPDESPRPRDPRRHDRRRYGRVRLAPAISACATARIVAIGQVDGVAAEEIDASGQVVAPGFIDIHTHYDAQIFWDRGTVPEPLARCDVGGRGQLRLRRGAYAADPSRADPAYPRECRGDVA